MKVQDFGHFDGPVVLFGGIYSNKQALLAMRDAIGRRTAVCTGGIVGFCADPNESSAIFREEDFWSVAGNSERQLAVGSEDRSFGFEAESTCSALARDWWAYLLKTATPDVVTWLHNLPDFGIFQHQGRRYAVLHGGASSVSRFLWPSTDASDFTHEIRLLESEIGAVDGVVAGHSGIAFHRWIDGRHWINAGAIGMPPHDGRRETRYAVLHNCDITFERLSYDASAAANAMRRVGLTQGYEKALESGIWPSEDILPDELRR
ncbi:MAG: metallophosphoesterase [Boseongicola sp.]|nr:metallophosphoesterase [Boseongicola sp.]